MEPQALKHFAAGIAAREMFLSVATVLHRSGIAVMPLKGILLQHTVFRDPAERPVSDIDVLVPENDLLHACALLFDQGFQRRETGHSAITMKKPDSPLPLDLHWRLFRPSLFRLSTRAMFRRGHMDEKIFGIPIVLPHPHDVYAHLVGHFVKGRLDHTDIIHMRDFAVVASRHQLHPKQVASHLENVNMARAAHYCLRVISEHANDNFAAKVLESLPIHRMDKVSIATAKWFASQYPPPAHAGIVSVHLLNSSLPTASLSLTQHIAHGVWNRIKRT